jgi:hypothetical protein
MEIKEFKITRNRQRPDFCYSYEKYNEDKSLRFSIFTMDGGKSFLASIHSANMLNGHLTHTDFSVKVNSPETALIEFNGFLMPKP